MRTAYMVCYDIRDEKRLRRVFRIVNGYGDAVQYSVFFCELSAKEYTEMADALNAVIHHTEDQVLFVPLGPARDGRILSQLFTLGQKLTLGARRSVVV